MNMNVNISSRNLHLCRDIEEEWISIGNDKAYLIESRLSSMLGEFNCSSYRVISSNIY